MEHVTTIDTHTRSIIYRYNSFTLEMHVCGIGCRENYFRDRQDVLMIIMFNSKVLNILTV